MKERAFSYLCGLKGKSGVILAERESLGFMVNKKEIWHSVCNNYSPRRDKDKKECGHLEIFLSLSFHYPKCYVTKIW